MLFLKLATILLILVTGCLSYAFPTRPKRQLFREDIPHHRPLTGGTYHHHAGFPHPGRFHDNAGEIVPPDPDAPPTPGPDLPPGEIPDPPRLSENENSNDLFGPPHQQGPYLGNNGAPFLPSPHHTDLHNFLALGHNELGGSPSNVYVNSAGGVSYSWSTRHR